MRELGNALGRFAGGLSNIDELRDVFREYLRAHPERREAVARWLAEGIKIGRLSPAIMLTIGDLIAPAKGSTKPAAPRAASPREAPANAAPAAGTKAGESPVKGIRAPNPDADAGPAKAAFASGAVTNADPTKVPVRGAPNQGARPAISPDSTEWLRPRAQAPPDSTEWLRPQAQSSPDFVEWLGPQASPHSTEPLCPHDPAGATEPLSRQSSSDPTDPLRRQSSSDPTDPLRPQSLRGPADSLRPQASPGPTESPQPQASRKPTDSRQPKASLGLTDPPRPQPSPRPTERVHAAPDSETRFREQPPSSIPGTRASPTSPNSGSSLRPRPLSGSETALPAKSSLRANSSSDLDTVLPDRSPSRHETRSSAQTSREAQTQFFTESSSDSEDEFVLEIPLDLNTSLDLEPTFFPEDSQSPPESELVPHSPLPAWSEPPPARSRPAATTTQTGASLIEVTNFRAYERATDAEHGDAAKAGDVLDGRYTLVAELGRGGMGSVFKARDRNREDFQARNPYIALKLLSEEFRSHPDARMALQRETERAQSLAHENIVRVFDFDYDGPHAYMTMELLDGQSLEDWLNEPNYARVPFARKWSIVRDIGAALACAHKHGVVHSDLKPANVFLCNSGTAKVMDFGIARPLRDLSSGADTTLFDPAERLGGLTPAYASLEQWDKEAPDPRDDIYAFACVIYHIFAGRHPRGRILSKSDLERCPPPQRIRSLTHRQWDTLRRGLALKRADRMASVEEFLHDFAPRTWFERYRKRLWSAGALIAAVLLYFGVQYYQDFEEDQALNAQLWPSVEAPTSPLTEDQRRDIDDYLYLGREALQQAATARSAEELSALLSKGANNLLELLKRVRELDPSNPQALKMTAAATHLYENLARVMLDANRPADALKLVIEGQKFGHTHELFQLKRTICSRSATACRPAGPQSGQAPPG